MLGCCLAWVKGWIFLENTLIYQHRDLHLGTQQQKRKTTSTPFFFNRAAPMLLEQTFAEEDKHYAFLFTLFLLTVDGLIISAENKYLRILLKIDIFQTFSVVCQWCTLKEKAVNKASLIPNQSRHSTGSVITSVVLIIINSDIKKLSYQNIASPKNEAGNNRRMSEVKVDSKWQPSEQNGNQVLAILCQSHFISSITLSGP